MFPTAIIFEDLTARAAAEFAIHPHKELVWLLESGCKFAFGRAANGVDIELIEFVPAKRAEPQIV